MRGNKDRTETEQRHKECTVQTPQQISWALIQSTESMNFGPTVDLASPSRPSLPATGTPQKMHTDPLPTSTLLEPAPKVVGGQS